MFNAKGALQEYCVSKKVDLPVYTSKVVSLPPNSRSTSTVSIVIDDEHFTFEGEGQRKRDAEHKAAENALKVIKHITPVEKIESYPELEGDNYLFIVDQENSPCFVSRYYSAYPESSFYIFATKGASSISKLQWPDPSKSAPSNVSLILTQPGFKDGADIALAFELGGLLQSCVQKSRIEKDAVQLYSIVLVSSDKIFYGLQAHISKTTPHMCIVIDG